MLHLLTLSEVLFHDHRRTIYTDPRSTYAHLSNVLNSRSHVAVSKFAFPSVAVMAIERVRCQIFRNPDLCELYVHIKISPP